jgi:hypothetical protein
MDKYRDLLVGVEPIYIQRFFKKTHYTPEICDWMLREIIEIDATVPFTKTEKGKTILKVDAIQPIFNYVMISTVDMIKQIRVFYQFDESDNRDKYKYGVDAFIEKQTPETALDEYTYQTYQADDSSITVKILLSRPTHYTGGGIQFEDYKNARLTQGSMVTYNGLVKYRNRPVKEGTIYYLVVHLNIQSRREEEWWEKELENKYDGLIPVR